MSGKLSINDFFKGQMRLLENNSLIDDNLILQFDKLKRNIIKNFMNMVKRIDFQRIQI